MTSVRCRALQLGRHELGARTRRPTDAGHIPMLGDELVSCGECGVPGGELGRPVKSPNLHPPIFLALSLDPPVLGFPATSLLLIEHVPAVANAALKVKVPTTRTRTFTNLAFA